MNEMSATQVQFGGYNALQDFQATFGQIGALLSQQPSNRGQAQWQLNQVMGHLEGLEQRSRSTDPDRGRQFRNVFDELRDRLNSYERDPSSSREGQQAARQFNRYLSGVRQHVNDVEQHFQVNRNQVLPHTQPYHGHGLPFGVPIPGWPLWPLDPCRRGADIDGCLDDIFGPNSTRRAIPDGRTR